MERKKLKQIKYLEKNREIFPHKVNAELILSFLMREIADKKLILIKILPKDSAMINKFVQHSFMVKVIGNYSALFQLVSSVIEKRRFMEICRLRILPHVDGEHTKETIMVELVLCYYSVNDPVNLER